jgi:tRNA (mo5U34)-methyltransferase
MTLAKIRRFIGSLRTVRTMGSDENFQFDGFTEGRTPTKHVDVLTDNELRELNAILRWYCFTVDGRGRRFGRRAWPGKRDAAQPIPDSRIALLDRKFGLRDKDVLEVGCFEGVHTIGLSLFARSVTAVDSRVENVVKTMVRCGFFDCKPTVFKCDVERREDMERLPQVDVIHHVGVLYHLLDPVTHLLALGRIARFGLMLDTHFALEEQAVHAYRVNDRDFRYQHFHEGGKGEVFSGMSDHAKWLRLDDIQALLREQGFREIEIAEKRSERNGARVLLFARRSG